MAKRKSVYDEQDESGVAIGPILSNADKQIAQIVSCGKKDTYALGQILCETKEKIEHGHFLRYIREKWHGDISVKQAERHMAIYQRFEGHPKVVAKLKRTMLLEMSKDDCPSEICKLAVKDPKSFAPANLTRFKKLVQGFRAKTYTEDQFVERLKNPDIALTGETGNGRRKDGEMLKEEVQKVILRLGKMKKDKSIDPADESLWDTVDALEDTIGDLRQESGMESKTKIIKRRPQGEDLSESALLT